MVGSARANGKLFLSLCSQASECPSLRFLDQRCDSHQAHKLVDVAIESFDLLNAMYAAVHLLMLAATVTRLWAAVSTVIDTPSAAHVFHCIPPRASNLAYYSVVL